jgi:transposase
MPYSCCRSSTSYVRRNKTDRLDTEALLEAARCAGIQPVPVKTSEQQALQALHRVRTQWQRTRTARINTLRGMLREHGRPLALGARSVLTNMPRILEDADNGLPAQLCLALARVYDEVRALERDIKDIDRQLAGVAAADPVPNACSRFRASVSSPRRRFSAPSPTFTHFAAPGILQAGSD